MNRPIYLLFLLLGLGISQSGLAVNKTWTGATSTNWNTALNWDPVGVPSLADNVISINSSSNPPIIGNGTTAVVNELDLGAGAQLTINSGATLNVSGNQTDGARGIQILNGATLINHGTLNVKFTNDISAVAIAVFGSPTSTTVTNTGVMSFTTSNGGFLIQMLAHQQP